MLRARGFVDDDVRVALQEAERPDIGAADGVDLAAFSQSILPAAEGPITRW